MTGFASVAAIESENTPVIGDQRPAAGTATVEIRSVNSRFLDIVLKLPDESRGLEPSLREQLSKALKRGKVELRIASARDGESGLREPTPEQLHRLARIESTVLGWSRQARPLSVDEILAWCRSAPPPTFSGAVLLEAADRCIDALKSARAREGGRLATMMLERVKRLRELRGGASTLAAGVGERQQARFLERWNEALARTGTQDIAMAGDALRERALAEATAYALRVDVAEELSRLDSHLDEVERLLQAGGEVGKRLEFLIQELQREANTLGAKSSALELTSIAVEMKVAIEQMREQVQNVE